MEKVWLKSYPAGVPGEVDAGGDASLVEMFERSFSRFRERTAYIGTGARLTYGELDEGSRRFAAYLQSVLKLPRGARVAIMLPNLVQYPVCMIGILRAGCVVVNCNPLYTARELRHLLSDSGAETVVILESFAHVLERALPGTAVKHAVIVRVGDMLTLLKGMAVNFFVRQILRKVPEWHLPDAAGFRRTLSIGSRSSFRPVPITQDDLAFLQYTGGTTGVCKAAMLTHRNLLANLAQTHAWVESTLTEGGESIVTALPLYHIFAMMANCFLMLKIGASNLLIADPRNIPAFVAELRRYPFSIITGVNTLFNALLDDDGFRRLDFSRLKIALGGGMSIQKSVADRWQQLTGKPLIEAYGLTETSPAVTINPPDLPHFNGMIGLPVPSTEVAIRDDRGGDLPLGECGELCVRGPQVMRAYYGQPDETAKVFWADGFLRTGDLAVMRDDGYLCIMGRKKDLILVSGFNVYSAEVEEVVAMHPGVAEAAAVGVPDEKTGEAVKIFVVRKDPSLTAGELLALCRENLTRYKVPTHVEFRTELPKSTIGKVLHRALREGG